MQGVKINDKHIEVIVRQMLKKAIIKDPGDSDLLTGKKENISTIKEINKKLKNDNKKPIYYFIS